METIKRKCKLLLLENNNNKVEYPCLIKFNSTNVSKPLLNLLKQDGRFTKDYLESQNIKPYHLYIISDDKIKDGNWFLNTKTNKIYQCNNNKDFVNETYLNSFESKIYKKIISTTDLSLKNSLNILRNNLVENTLPQPSQQFITKYIEEYNKGNIIEDVLVEYLHYECNNGHVMDRETVCTYPHCGKFNFPKIKVNPKDNTITIKRIKDSWNREEVRLSFMYALSEFAAERGLTPTSKEMKEVNEWSNNWISKNL